MKEDSTWRGEGEEDRMNERRRGRGGSQRGAGERRGKRRSMRIIEEIEIGGKEWERKRRGRGKEEELENKGDGGIG